MEKLEYRLQLLIILLLGFFLGLASRVLKSEPQTKTVILRIELPKHEKNQ